MGIKHETAANARSPRLEGKENTMIRRSNNAGFTLIELMIVVAIIAIIASIAIPKLMAARLSANEAAAISTLRSVSSAQAQLQSSGAIDTDADGGGEYGYFSEMAGIAQMRVADTTVAPVVPQDGAATDILTPAVLSSAFGAVVDDVNGDGMISRSGYNFQMWLPAAGPAPIAGVPEAGNGAGAGGLSGGATAGGPYPDPQNAEILWACYAWPMQANGTGNRAFFINEQGDLLQTANRGNPPAYTGNTGPTFDAAFTTAADMSSPLRIGVAGAGAQADIWTPVQ